jgi:hypothetical protein
MPHSRTPEVVVRVANGEVGLKRLLLRELEPAVKCCVLFRARWWLHDLPSHHRWRLWCS